LSLDPSPSDWAGLLGYRVGPRKEEPAAFPTPRPLIFDARPATRPTQVISPETFMAVALQVFSDSVFLSGQGNYWPRLVVAGRKEGCFKPATRLPGHGYLHCHRLVMKSDSSSVAWRTITLETKAETAIERSPRPWLAKDASAPITQVCRVDARRTVESCR